jgi:hypothetical protein
MEQQKNPVLNYVDRIAWMVMAVAIVAACSLPLATAWAGTEAPEQGGQGGQSNANAPCLLFTYLDANHDGVVSLAEARRMRGFEAAFLQADENHDNRLSRDEFFRAQLIHDQLRGATFLINDALVNNRVKNALGREQDLRGLAIMVETYDSQVILGGLVDSPSRARRAIEVASAVTGVEAVKSTLEINIKPLAYGPGRALASVSK